MITPELMLGHLVDWTDPEKAMWARLWSSRAFRFLTPYQCDRKYAQR